MSEPKVELKFVASTTQKAAELGWKLKQIANNHRTRQEKLLKELQDKSGALAAKYQKQQHATFEQLRVELDISDADWGDGSDWSLSIEDLTDGIVALVHATHERYAAYDEGAARDDGYDDDCDCIACQIRRAMTTDEEHDDPEKPGIDLRRLH